MGVTAIPLIAIVGPTAVGKTALAVTSGEILGAEIVSADSRQVYRRLEIGTAKPTPEERARVPHHLLDVVEPDEPFGLSDFLRLARAALADITARGRLPFLVGGTGQYIHALLKGWQLPAVPPDPALRAALEATGRADPDALWAQLLALDPDAATFIDRRNLRRVIRALEVCLKTGEPFSTQRRADPPPYRVLTLGLTMSRPALYARADARVEAMLAAGLADEVQTLLAAGYGWELPSLSGLGYAQFKPYFTGQASLDDVAAQIKTDTHAFIRRQYAWFRLADPTIHWLDAAGVAEADVVALVQAWQAEAKRQT